MEKKVPTYTIIRQVRLRNKYHSRFFVQVGHETTYAAIGNHHFFIKTCHRQTHQNY